MRKSLVFVLVAALAPGCLLDRLGGLAEETTDGAGGTATTTVGSSTTTTTSSAGGMGGASSSTTGATGGASSSSTGGGGAGGMPPVGPCHPTGLEDAFAGSAVNTNLWNGQGKQSIMTVSGGVLRVTPEDSVTDDQWVGLVTSATYDLTGCAVWIEVPSVIKSGLEGETYWQIHSSQGVGRIRVIDGELEATVTDQGNDLGDASQTYVAASHRWWRIREDTGMLYLEVSADFVTWNTMLATAAPAYVSAITVGLGVVSPTEETNMGQTQFDNFNIVP